MHDPPPTVGFHRAARRVVRFGSFRADYSDGSLWRDGNEVKLPPRALAVLFYLVERPGRLVTKSDLLDSVWKDANVSETSLTEAIGILRHTLGDDAQHPTFIQTVHRRGYRFVAPLSFDSGAPADLTLVGPDVVKTQKPGIRGRVIAIAGVVVAIAVAAVVVGWLTLRGRQAPDVSRVTITLPADQAPAPGLNANPVAALSPDGRRLVYVAGSTSAYRLFVRTMDQFDARPLPGTEGGHGPFFSPDGAEVAFFSGGRLKRMRLDGGAPIDVAEAGAGLGGSWGRDGRIVLARGWLDGLWEVGAGGGSPRLIAEPPDATSGYLWPQVLDDGDTIIATSWRSNQRDASVVAVSRRTGAHRVLAAPGSYGRVIAGDIFVFMRDGALLAARFANGRLTSTPEVAVDQVLMGLRGAAQFAASDAGHLLYMPDDPERTHRAIAAATLGGDVHPSTLPERAYQNVVVCGERIATSVLERGVSDIWVGDLARGVLTRLTDQAMNLEPVWQPDCRTIVFASSGSGVLNMYRMRAEPGAVAERLQSSALIQAPSALSADGRELVYTEISPKTRADIWRRHADGRREPIVATAANETAARLSPDGRWIAYQGEDRGSTQVFVTSARGPGERIQVSADGGSLPGWSVDGRRIFYRRGQHILAADVDGSGVLRAGKPEVVLQNPDLVLFRVLSHDRLLLVLRRKEHLPLTKLLLILNWQTEVRGLLESNPDSTRR